MVAPHAGELIQELLVLQSKGLPLRTLLAKTYPYPTATRIHRAMALAYEGRKLTGWAKRLLQWAYALKR